MIDMLPQQEQDLAFEFIKRLVLAWDPDYTKVTPDEAEAILQAEKSGFVSAEKINWDNVEQYVNN